jgi:hypothetical protein
MLSRRVRFVLQNVGCGEYIVHRNVELASLVSEMVEVSTELIHAAGAL